MPRHPTASGGDPAVRGSHSGDRSVMDRYTYETRMWLEQRFDPRFHRELGSDYRPYQPLHGVAPGAWGPNQFLMAARVVRLLATLKALDAQSFLDVGGAEGWVARIVRDTFGIDVVSVDLAHQAALRAVEYSGVPAAGADSARLPFRDRSFDAVFLSEVLEHLANPVRSLLEIRRVCARAAIVTTEAFARSDAERRDELAARELAPHMDRSIFCPEDFGFVFPDFGLRLTNQCSRLPDPLPADVDEARAELREKLLDDGLDWPAHGLVVVADRRGTPPDATPFVEEMIDVVCRWMTPRRREPHVPSRTPLPPELAARLMVPEGRATDFREEPGILVETPSGRGHPLIHGAPAIYAPIEAPFAESVQVRLERTFGAGHPSVAALLALDELLRFDLPVPSPATRFLAPGAPDLAPAAGVALASEADGGVIVTATAEDPWLVTPRLRRPASAVRGFAVEVAALDRDGGEEQVQVFWHTLLRPLWWERGSAVASYPADGGWHRVELPLPAGTGAAPDDELLQLRLDPGHAAGRYALRGFQITV